MKNRDAIPALIWIIIGLAVMMVSYRMSLGTLHSPGPGLLPFLLGSFLIVASLPILVGSFLALRRTGPDNRGAEIWAGVEFKNLLIIVISLVAYALLLESLGFILTAFLFLFLLFATFDSRRWFFALGISSVTICITYILFNVVLRVELPSGLLRIW